jgi:hypothetical protein
MKYALIATLLLVSLNAGAQKVRFSDTSNEWYGFMAHENGTAWGFEPYNWDYQGDTIIDATVYHKLVTGLGFTPNFAIREDTVNGHIFFRLIWPGFPVDTLEHLFFDYNLKVNDTFRVHYGSYYSVHHVSAIGSVLLGGTPHRTWSMVPDSSFSRLAGTMAYTFVEGLGSLDQPIMSASNTSYDHEARLLCFHTRGSRPLMSPRMVLFDNDSSCSYWPVGIDNIGPPSGPITLSPNPCTGTITLRYPATVFKTPITVRITDMRGSVVHSSSFIPQGNSIEICLGEEIPPQMYSILIYTSEGAPLYRGKFLKR